MLQLRKGPSIRILSVFIAALLLCAVGCSPTRYNVQNITERCGWERYSERDFKLGGVMTHNIWNAGSRETDNDYMSFYICPSDADAKRAFRFIRKNWFSEITEVGDNYVQGWESGVCDAYIEKLVYISDNLIVTVDVKCVSAWSDEAENDMSGSGGRDDTDFQRRVKQELTENW